jgi:hypothetical protein
MYFMLADILISYSLYNSVLYVFRLYASQMHCCYVIIYYILDLWGFLQAQHIIGNKIIPIQVNNICKLGMKTTL